LQLGEVAEIEVQMFSFVQKFNRRTELEFITKSRHFAKLLLPAALLFTQFTHCILSFRKKNSTFADSMKKATQKSSQITPP